MIINKSKKRKKNEERFNNNCLLGIEDFHIPSSDLEFKISSKLRIMDINQLRIDKENIKEIKEKSFDVNDIILIELPHNRFYNQYHKEIIFRFIE